MTLLCVNYYVSSGTMRSNYAWIGAVHVRFRVFVISESDQTDLLPDLMTEIPKYQQRKLSYLWKLGAARVTLTLCWLNRGITPP